MISTGLMGSVKWHSERRTVNSVQAELVPVLKHLGRCVIQSKK